MKECRHCKQSIHSDARICHHCKGSQAWAANQTDPRFLAVMFGLIFIIIVPVVVWLPKFMLKPDTQLSPPALSIKESSARYEVTECCTRVFVLGQVENTSATDASRIWFRINVINKAGHIVDTLLESQSGLVVPGHATKLFRVDGIVSVKPDEVGKTEVTVERSKELSKFD